MNKRDHLKRLSREHYMGDAMVHWIITLRDREQDWLSATFYYRFRELLTHTMFRFGLACPIFCLMPDHFHMIWMGLCDESNQQNAIKHFRTNCNASLERIGYELQDQAFDHVLKEDERQDTGFRNVCEYIARNPERSEIVKVDGYASYPYTGCILPGYPELRPSQEDFWDQFDKVISFLRKEGLMRK